VRTRIDHGTVVTATASVRADLLIEDETIAALGATASGAAADLVLDAAGKLVLPGGIDAHTHLDMPLTPTLSAADDFASGTIAAALGGTTTIVDYATQTRGDTLAGALAAWHARADGRAAIDYGFHMIVSDWNAAVERELEAMVAAGVTSFKLFTAYPDRLMLDDGAIFRVLSRAAELGALTCIHAENGHVIQALVERARAAGRTAPKFHAATRPARAEAEAVGRVAALAEIAGAPLLVVHLSSAEGLEEVERARARGVDLHAETCPQYLLLADDAYEAPGFDGARYVMSPPLRPASAHEPLWRGLAAGAIETVATDHCPFRLADKALGRHDFALIPNGAPGIETRMMLVWDAGVRSGRLSANRFVEITATAPARLFGLHPRKGEIAVGADADLLIWDPERAWTISAATHASRCDYSLYEGRRGTGAPAIVISRGRVVVEDGRFLGRPGDGRYLPRAARAA
jgi:dihydropyrimidinase